MHNMESLFGQLGLSQKDEDIKTFIETKKPLPGNVELHKASFWSPAQASFIKEAVEEDADWAEIVDQLDAMLR